MRRSSLLVFFCLVSAAWCQQPAPDSDHELIRQLLKRVQELESEVQRLKGSRMDPGAAVSPATPDTATAVPPVPAPEPAPAAPQDHDMMHGSASDLPRMQFRGFTDIQYRAMEHQGTNTFSLGELNLFITSRLSDKLNFVTELVTEADRNNVFSIEPERLVLQYSANDYLNLSFGRFHSAIGYYNTAYHHSTWLQTAVDRPFLFEFEDRGGILPIHNVGLSATGRIPSGSLGLHYVAEFGNGRTSRSLVDEPVQSFRDENNGKSYNIAVFARPEGIPGFQTGFSFYHDRLFPAGAPKIRQDIFAAHAVYQAGQFEFLNEVVTIRNALEGSRVLHTPAFYTQLSRRFGQLRPYFRYEYMNVPAADPIFGDVGLRQGPSLGLRYDFAEFAAFKIEYNRLLRRDLLNSNGLTTQLSFTF